MITWGDLISLFFIIYSIIIAGECFLGAFITRKMKKREPMMPMGAGQKEDKYLRFK